MTWRPEAVAEIARRATRGEDRFDQAVREFLDSWQAMSREERVAAVAEEPAPLGRVEDAYLAALAEHLASGDRIDACLDRGFVTFPRGALLCRRARIA